MQYKTEGTCAQASAVETELFFLGEQENLREVTMVSNSLCWYSCYILHFNFNSTQHTETKKCPVDVSSFASMTIELPRTHDNYSVVLL